MSYHIVSIDAPSCSLSCKNGQLTCSTDDGTKSIPIEDVAAVVITSFSASIHSKLLLEAAKHGIGLVICENFKPASLVLPANRATDTHLTKAQMDLPSKVRERLWVKTINAKTLNQYLLAKEIAPNHKALKVLEMTAKGRKEHKEALCARFFWRIYGETVSETDDFKRGRAEGSINPLLNYGYAVLLSTILQNCFALGIDPTFGINHAVRERSTPLAYDLMEPFRPCVDWRVAQWVKQHPDTTDWEVTKEFRQWITGFPTVKVDYFELQIDIRSCIEGVIRSFRKALIKQQSVHYKPWTQQNSKWVG